MRDLFNSHLRDVENWLMQQEFFSLIQVSYNQILKDPLGQSIAIKQFLGAELDAEKMAAVVDDGLYRQRTP